MTPICRLKSVYQARLRSPERVYRDGGCFGLLIRHYDEREFAYTDLANKAIAEASTQGWITVSVKNDWKTVFARHAPG
jgi:hypothetical protein